MIESIPSSGDQYKADYSQRHGILFVLYAIWILSLPFNRFSLIATYSFDNLLAPVLCLLAVLLPRLRDRGIATWRFKVLLVMVLLYTINGVAGILKFIQAPELLWPAAWRVLRDSFYFLVPALYLRDLWSFRIMKRLLIWVAMAGAISAFLAAIGVIHLEVARFAESRLSVEWLPKSVGLLSNYGDLSILYGFVAVLLISHGRVELGFMGGRFVKLMIWGTLLLGLAGSQSRNMILSTITAIGGYWLWRRIQNARSKQRTAVIGLFLAGAIMLPAITVFFGDTIVGSISTLGGKKAEHTAVQRIESYSKAISLLASEPFGVSYQTYKRYAPLIDHIHNLWLKLLLNSGPIGMSAIAALFWLAYKGGSRPPQPPLLAAEPAMVVASAAAMFIAVEFYGGQSNIMWVMLGTLISFNWVRRQDSAKSVVT